MTAGRYNRYPNRENLLSECNRFLLQHEEAGRIIDRIQAVVSARWQAVMKANGVTQADCNRLAAAFNYPGSELPAPAALPI